MGSPEPPTEADEFGPGGLYESGPNVEPERSSVPPDGTEELRRIHAERMANLRSYNAELLERVNQLERQLADERDAKQRNEAAMLRLGGKVNQLEQALRYIADPTNHHHKPDYVRPEVVAQRALSAAGEERPLRDQYRDYIIARTGDDPLPEPAAGEDAK